MGQLHVFFFPMMAQGHMIPTLDIAKLFASRGVKSTIITTPLNAHYFAKSAEKTNQLGFQLEIKTIKFPVAAAGLPEGCESVDLIPSDDMIPNFFKATALLQGPLEQALDEARPDCLVADMFFPWATESAAKFGIPSLVFHGTSFFALCARENLRLYKPQRQVSSDDEPFLLPHLPHQIKLTKMQLPDHERSESESETCFARFFERMSESELSSYGVIANSFYELEPEYADYYRDVLKRKAWPIGPVSLCNREIEDKVQRGKEASIDERKCLEWLDSKKPNSVIYVCFGSAAKFDAAQLHEIAMGLESSGQPFIWVVRKGENDNEDWLPEGFEERMKDEGLIIRGWAPQLLILDHEGVGSFVTHCGWNSTLEGISAGVSMVTWPAYAEQFYNEKLVTEILKIGVSVGALKWSKSRASAGVTREQIGKAVQRAIVGNEAEEMRNRANALKKKAKRAIEEGGSSHTNLNDLLRELSCFQT